MELLFTDYLWAKLAFFVVLAFFAGLFGFFKK
jgi:hypothetical protein